MAAAADVDNRDGAAAASICHTDSRGMDADWGLQLMELRCSVHVCVPVFVCVHIFALLLRVCVRKGR